MKNSCTRKKYNISKIKLLLSQITLFIMLIIIWELLAHFNIINTFLFSILLRFKDLNEKNYHTSDERNAIIINVKSDQ